MWPGVLFFIAIAWLLFYFFGIPGAVLGLIIIAVLLALCITWIAGAISDEIKLWRK